MKESRQELLNLLREGVAPAIGCIEPIAVAFAVAKARKQTTGNLEYIEVQVDSNIYKNGLMVTIPGTKEKGLITAAALEARMSGSRLPVMSTAGSGNHGITAFLTNYAVTEKRQLSQEKLLRSLALTNLITFFNKHYTGTLSAMCGCGVAAGTGASVGVFYLLGGNKEQIMGALYNMIGSISGVICDGAKEGCAYKLALASGWVVQSALLSLKGAIIHNTDGIIDPDFRQLFKSLGYVCDPGMIPTDQAILDVILTKT